jgi:hypothetical protein
VESQILEYGTSMNQVAILVYLRPTTTTTTTTEAEAEKEAITVT